MGTRCESVTVPQRYFEELALSEQSESKSPKTDKILKMLEQSSTKMLSYTNREGYNLRKYSVNPGAESAFLKSIGRECQSCS